MKKEKQRYAIFEFNRDIWGMGHWNKVIEISKSRALDAMRLKRRKK